MILTRGQFHTMSFREISKHHGLKEADFISQAFPPAVVVRGSEYWYRIYEQWYKRTQNKLAKAMR